MSQDIPLQLKVDLSSRNWDDFIAEVYAQWAEYPDHSKLYPPEKKRIKRLEKLTESQVAESLQSALCKIDMESLNKVRTQIHDMLVLWEWVIRAKKRYDNDIRPFFDEEHKYGPTIFLACLPIISARAAIVNDRWEAPTQRDVSPAAGYNSIDSSEDEAKEPLEGWKRFKKSLDGTINTLVGGSSKENFQTLPRQRKYGQREDGSDGELALGRERKLGRMTRNIKAENSVSRKKRSGRDNIVNRNGRDEDDWESDALLTSRKRKKIPKRKLVQEDSGDRNVPEELETRRKRVMFLKQ